MSRDEILQVVGDALVRLGEQLRGAAPAQLPAPSTEPKYMSLTQYGARAGYSRSTVRSWIESGMPSVPAGRGRRVLVKAADEWLAAGGARRAAQERSEENPKRARGRHAA